MKCLYTYVKHDHKIIKREVLEEITETNWLVLDPNIGPCHPTIDHWNHSASLQSLLAIIWEHETADYAKATRRMDSIKEWMDQQRKNLA